MRKYYIIYNDDKLDNDDIESFKSSINSILNKNLSYEIIKITEINNYNFHKFSDYTKFIFVIGGDGTVLSVARKLYNIDCNIFPINAGHCGFLTQYELNDILTQNVNDEIKQILTGTYKIDKRSLLEIEYNGKYYYALNDFVLNRAGTDHNMKMINVYVVVNDLEDCFNEEHYGYSYRGDGIIFSTPTGSTAYNLSAGGPIIDPHSNSIIITPINSQRSFFTYPLVVNNKYEILIELNDIDNSFDKTNIFGNIDGQDYFIVDFNKSDEIYIRKSKYYVNFVNIHGNSFYNLIDYKFN